MNQSDRDILDKQGEQIAGLRLSCDEGARNTELLADEIKNIKDNHLHTIQETIDLKVPNSPLYLTLEFLKQKTAQNWKITVLCFAVLAIVVAISG